MSTRLAYSERCTRGTSAERTATSVAVISSLFPRPSAPLAGIFIYERMRRVGARLPVTVLSPTPYFPGQWVLRLLDRNYRPPTPRRWRNGDTEISYPRFLAFPGLLRGMDARSIALCLFPHVRRLKENGGADVLDAHFAYPDGVAAALLADWLNLPYTITLRGSEPRLAQEPGHREQIGTAMRNATRVFTVSESLRRFAIELGAAESRTRTVPNGVDLDCFQPLDRARSRRSLGLPENGKVLITVGGLVERKGQHRVIDVLPELLTDFPDIHYVLVGGGSGEGDWTGRLEGLAREKGVSDRVHFLGQLQPEQLALPLSASDVFVLSSRNEGWANVLLEAMACGIPVVTTDVGGSREVVRNEDIGIVIPFDDRDALLAALRRALLASWDREAILAYARANTWDDRIQTLIDEFTTLASRNRGTATRELLRGDDA